MEQQTILEQSLQIWGFILEYKIPEGVSKEQRMKKERKKKKNRL